MPDTSERVAVIAGAGRKGSIGRAIAERLLSDGYRVLASDLGSPLKSHPDYEIAPSDDLDDLERDHDKTSLRIARCDVSSEDEVQALFQTARDSFGRVDAAINCAGLGIGLTRTVDLSLRDWNVNINVMATGAFLFAREAARQMLHQNEGGRIVTIASQAGKTGIPYLSAYCAAKFAVIGLTQSMAAELGENNITVNAVCPGTIDTPLLSVKGGVYDTFSSAAGYSTEDYQRRVIKHIPMRRLGQPDDIASAVSYLVSPDASFVTGESLNVTGGEEVH